MIGFSGRGPGSVPTGRATDRPAGTNAADRRERSTVAAGDEADEGLDRRQALVAGLNLTTAVLLKVSEELQHSWRSDVLDVEAVYGLANLGADEWQQQCERVAVALLRTAGEAALGDDVVDQEAPELGAGGWLRGDGALVTVLRPQRFARPPPNTTSCRPETGLW